MVYLSPERHCQNQIEVVYSINTDSQYYNKFNLRQDRQIPFMAIIIFIFVFDKAVLEKAKPLLVANLQ